MQYENRPIRKTSIYRINFTTNFIDIEIQQATAKEIMEFYNKDIQWQIKDISDLLENWKLAIYRDKKIRESRRSYELNKYKHTQEIILLLLVNNADKIYSDIVKIKHPTYKSIFDGIQIPKSKDGNRKSIFNLDLMTICSEYNINWPDELLKNYTYEQIGYMYDGIRFRSYEMDKKTRYINDKAMFTKKWWLSEKETTLLDKLKKWRELLQNNNK